ncbi:hypothetical protein FGO68_gene1296 [Halteria grandinella]|uniref:Uncharacterized protein n=1 Tax=Halteria grandinella TaxID=5974 RepID=A0A8J8NP07_HALGN|nr:hypothetical protein FGO68_gene1296 [Halteria grandinella]
MLPSFTKACSNQLLNVTSVQQLQDLREKNRDKCVLFLFWAHWYRECEIMRRFFEELTQDHHFVKFAWADVDRDKEITKFFKVTAVPFIVMMHPDKQEIEKVTETKRSSILEVVTAYEAFYSQQFMKKRKQAFAEIEELLKSYPIIIFIRGSALSPECKQSEVLIDYFQKMEIKFRTVDILSNPQLKEWVKHFSGFPSFPQIFVNGKFVGSAEMVIDMIESDEFINIIPQECIKTNALERIKVAMAKSPVVLFMKGTPTKPYDGYQQEAIQLLDKERIRYAFFDVMKDPDVRELLKEYSKCQSYPQVFISGQFMGGGLTYMKELDSLGKLSHAFPQTEIIVVAQQKIEKLVSKGKYMVFIRGMPNHPVCLESKKMMDMLQRYPRCMKELEHFDLTKDAEITKSLIEYSNFREVPQLYVDHRLVGGVEIVEGLDQTGELQEILGPKEKQKLSLIDVIQKRFQKDLLMSSQ